MLNQVDKCDYYPPIKTKNRVRHGDACLGLSTWGVEGVGSKKPAWVTEMSQKKIHLK